jgi:cell wall-associated NlpC family hydrolase
VATSEALKYPGRADDSGPVEAAALPKAPEARERLRKLTPRRAVIGAAVAACALAAAGVALFSGGGGSERAATAAGRPAASSSAAPASAPTADTPQPPPLKPHPRVVRAVGPGQAPPDGVTAGSGHATGTAQPPSDAEVRSELAAFRQHLQGVGAARGPVAQARSDGTAVVPLDAPDVVAQVVAAGNEIATTPYKWGGGHGAWRDTGYDCSGSVSFALAGAGLLDSPLTSGSFMKWGAPGRGRWITILANDGHVFMVVAGLRFDTSGAAGGTRWQPMNGRSYAGFAVRHPPGL